MLRKVSCPQCAQPVNPKARYCEQCGVDLALAAVMAERTVISPAHVGETPLSPEILVPRIGDSMVDRGFLTEAQLRQALDFQRTETAKGRQILVGQAMIELGFVSREILDSIVTERILQLQTALQSLNRQLEGRVQERTQELQRALQRVGELNQLKSNFIANISHELRTPLTHIKGYLDLLVENSLGPLTEQQVDALAVIQRAETRLERLIEDLIQFSLESRG
ncbi:MAG TPA: histidine kinase dimerization/phospho-acceptor domain-containing protein, partial [Anaerolineales bacterium]|nr:histidine kinase dimerization/phospho-acceptor domain-containing protein [Anaerolineales bacterium]